MRPQRFDLDGWLVVCLTLAGIAILFWGLAGASPVIWTYSETEYASAREGRIVMAAAAAVLVAAAALVAVRGHRVRAVLVALPGIACLGLALAFQPPGGSWALLAFLPLAPLAIVAALPR